ncbi:MAG: DUF695 domain-containing protein [Candidatus Cryptobacteroides sp.]|nr:DUF695 domain-containing protein [Candidatus Cryptobacteroides sp.]
MGLKDILFAHKPKKKTVYIDIPKESFILLDTTKSEGTKSLMLINDSLRHHKDDTALKRVFAYFCSVTFYYNDIDETLWPSDDEFSIMQEFTESFDKALKVDAGHPNALFVARVTQKGTCNVIWMLHDAQTAIDFLDGVISEGKQIREFEYSIDVDTEWSNIEWFLQDFHVKGDHGETH